MTNLATDRQIDRHTDTQNAMATCAHFPKGPVASSCSTSAANQCRAPRPMPCRSIHGAYAMSITLYTRPITCEETHAHGERRKRREKPPTHGSISSRSSLSLQPSSHTPNNLWHPAADRGQPCFERGVPFLWTTRFDSYRNVLG